ncbi:MAG: hypothetical protein R3F55_13995 [Alphaproteobacteria bacterium]
MSDDTQRLENAGIGPWILGFLMGVLGLFGLIMASGAHDDGIYVIGLILFLINAVSIFVLIARFVGRHRPQH